MRRGALWAKGSAGTSMLEMVVVLAILSVFATMALPHAQLAAKRDREAELRDNLRTIRRAIDAFHEDWRNEPQALRTAASPEGYPRTLGTLVEGVEIDGRLRRYLRRVPRNPFAADMTDSEDHWILLGYEDDPETFSGEADHVYEVRANSVGKAIDGTLYRDW